ncbi:hypothetical protein [Rathayibacter sp. AY1E6]|uniref:hypothetical protein n=1 Tax=Rathayibacter sp. AY1E6 TaxID=2080554 RepID=UPI0011B0189F|nr:hypothetical protein [Rathayibacter sp. AY1E6]
MELDPAAVATAAAATGAGVVFAKEGARVSADLVGRALGPAADELGEVLKGLTPWRKRNVERIAEKTQRKAGPDSGPADARTARRILDEGSYSDDEIMAEYLSGVLAVTKRDLHGDLGVPWAALIANLSSIQIRLHYLLYRQWAVLLEGAADLKLSNFSTMPRVQIQVGAVELLSGLALEGRSDALAVFEHAMFGLRRMGLIADEFHGGSGPDGGPAMTMGMTVDGLELYSWAIGRGAIQPNDFLSFGAVEGDYDDLPLLTTAVLPYYTPTGQ